MMWRLGQTYLDDVEDALVLLAMEERVHHHGVQLGQLVVEANDLDRHTRLQDEDGPKEGRRCTPPSRRGCSPARPGVRHMPPPKGAINIDANINIRSKKQTASEWSTSLM